MNGLETIACGSGLQDGLNPCIFMTCAVFIVHGLWLKKNSLRSIGPRIIFVLVYALGFLVFDFGPGQILIFQKDIIFAVKAVYFVLGVGTFVAGVLFFKDWFLLKRGLPAKDPADEKTKPAAGVGLAAYLTTIILAVVLSGMAVLWPIDSYIELLGNESLLKGQWQIVLPFLAGYIFSSMWALWFVWALLSIKGLRPSFLKIFCASIFFTASSCVIFMFK